MKRKIPDFRFLDDSPVFDDYFKTHEKIANTILDIVKKQKGGKAIALWGEWGSGKSSVIEMLKEKIENSKELNEQLAVFTFDSWEHEGDALKKAFLDELIKFLINKDWLKGKNNDTEVELKNEVLQKKYNSLHGKYKVERIRSKSDLTICGKILTILMFFVPFGLILLSYGFNRLKDDLDFPFIGYLGLSLSIAPVIFVIIFEIINCKRKQKKVDLFFMFFNRRIRRETTEKFETPDPSSIEFEDFYEDILQKSLSGKKKMIVVIDNLDRVEPDTGIALLSTIKPYIQCKFRKEVSCFQKIWYIIPFDKSSLERLWENEKGKSEFANSFIDKIFQIKLSVPPIVLLEWKNYFGEKLKEASSNYFSGDKTEIIRSIFEICYNLSKKEVKEFPTPRAIKLFINNFIASILLNPEIDFRAHTIFMGVRAYFPDEFDKLPDKLRHNTLSALSRLKPYLYDDWKKDLAALYFSVTPDKALHILLNNEIKEAIEKEDLSFFDEHKDVKGIKEVICSIIISNASEWIKNKPYMLGKTANIFRDDSNLLDIIYTHAKEIGNFKDLNSFSGEGFGILIRKYSDQEKFVIKVLKTLSNIGINI